MTKITYIEHVINFDFPLNVFAYCIYLHEGKVEYLHYGFFKETEPLLCTSVFNAQQQATDILISHLPPPPCRILEIGLGLGTTALQLAELGYTVTALCPDFNQVSLSKQLVKEKVTIVSATFETFSTTANIDYDVILLQESSQYILTNVLFEKASRLLKTNGIVLIADEVCLKSTTKHKKDNLPLLENIYAQSMRYGFDRIELVNLSTQAKPTLDFLIWAIETYKSELLARLNISSFELSDLVNSLSDYKQKYNAGYYGYVIQKFKKTNPTFWKTIKSFI